MKCGFCNRVSVRRHPPQGEHVLTEGESSASLYQLLPFQLACRLPTFSAPRALECTSLGLLSAPVGVATIVFMSVIGAQTLLAWDGDMMRESLEIYQALVLVQLEKHNGYMVSGH